MHDSQRQSDTVKASVSSPSISPTQRRHRRRRQSTGIIIDTKPSPSTLNPSTRSSITSTTSSVGAPSVWISPDWPSNPIIENFYGFARPRARVNSFYEVMCSPTNTASMPTTTLAANCCIYNTEEQLTSRSLSYSYSTETTTSDAATPPTPAHSNGFTAWSQLRQTVGDEKSVVPVPTSSNNKRRNQELDKENPQAGTSSPTSSTSELSNPSNPSTPTPSGRLRRKLFECLLQVDQRITQERELARKAHVNVQKTKKQVISNASLMWHLLCGATTSDAVGPSDGLTFLFERLAVAMHHRALNQLRRHRRHVNGILQIVTSHNPDLELTEKQLDSFESADAMLQNDVKYSLLHKQVEWLGACARRRQEALHDAKQKNGVDCFESHRIKVAMMAKLLEAVSWYRLVQTNARDESASSTVVMPSTDEDKLEASSASSSSAVSSSRRSLQELQVEKILNVLAGEDFYSDYHELMCHPDWWDIAQAHFENLVFSRADSRICQWIHRLSKDVVTFSHEELDDAQDLLPLHEIIGGNKTNKTKKPPTRSRAYSADAKAATAAAMYQHDDWVRDPEPSQLMAFAEKLSRRIRREFDVTKDVSKSLNAFVQRTVFARTAVLCFNDRTLRDCQRKDKLWRKRCVELRGVSMEQLNVPPDIADKICTQLPSRKVNGTRVYLIRAIDAFSAMESIVPCDLLEELMHGVVILHHEAALVLGTTQFSVETFFPLLAYVLLHCPLPRIHAQLHVLENFAITSANQNVNGEESYYVYCVHAAIEYLCNSTSLSIS